MKFRVEDMDREQMREVVRRVRPDIDDATFERMWAGWAGPDFEPARLVPKATVH